MSNIFATNGATIHIGPAKAFGGTDFTGSDFPSAGESAITWTKIGGVTDMGGVGDVAELISSNHIDTARTRKAKGTRNAGSMTIVADLDYADAGQLAVIAAEKAKETYAVKLTFNDAPAGGTPSLRYFVALVMSAAEQLDQANNTMKLNITLEIDSNVVRIAAAPGGG